MTLYTTRKNAQLFEHICNLFSELQSFFSFPILMILVVKFIAVIGNAFNCLFSVLSPSTTLDDSTLLLFLTSTTDWISILTILSAADMPVYRVRISYIRKSFSKC